MTHCVAVCHVSIEIWLSVPDSWRAQNLGDSTRTWLVWLLLGCKNLGWAIYSPDPALISYYLPHIVLIQLFRYIGICSFLSTISTDSWVTATELEPWENLWFMLLPLIYCCQYNNSRHPGKQFWVLGCFFWLGYLETLELWNPKVPVCWGSWKQWLEGGETYHWMSHWTYWKGGLFLLVPSGDGYFLEMDLS